MFKIAKLKKSVVGAVLVGAVLVASAVPVFASYYNTDTGVYQTGAFEGKIVQKVLNPTPMRTGPNTSYPIYMNMGINEMVVTSDSPFYSFRSGIAGKVGIGEAYGWVWDGDMRVVRPATTLLKSRVALQAKTIQGVASGQADIPAGVELFYPTDELRAYQDGGIVHISGYRTSPTSVVLQDCYVRTNFESGSVSNYFIQATAI